MSQNPSNPFALLGGHLDLFFLLFLLAVVVDHAQRRPRENAARAESCRVLEFGRPHDSNRNFFFFLGGGTAEKTSTGPAGVVVVVEKKRWKSSSILLL